MPDWLTGNFENEWEKSYLSDIIIVMKSLDIKDASCAVGCRRVSKVFQFF